MNELATLTVCDTAPLHIPVDVAKWERFLAAAETLGRSADTLLGESIDLCLDTTIAVATRRERDINT
jgi:hypothetical protein